jgi:uncharacterized paraquat-inducible protein A
LWADKSVTPRPHVWIAAAGTLDLGRRVIMKERRVRCKACGERFTVIRLDRERTSAYCDLCRADREREQARARMRAWRARQRS